MQIEMAQSSKPRHQERVVELALRMDVIPGAQMFRQQMGRDREISRG